MGGIFAFLAAYLASAVELVEAFTIILAVGVVRGWRAPARGAVAGFTVLALVVLLVGPALHRVPINDLRIVIGASVTIFGLHWLRKAILRSSGYKPLRDEDDVYRTVTAEARRDARPKATFDWYSFTIAFKAIVLEGLEVVFIVLSFGGVHGHLPAAILAAVAAAVTVAIAGIIARAPLTRVPENTMKFCVGILLTSVGIFWLAEGLGVQWPGAEAALPIIAAVVATASVLLVSRLRTRRAMAHDAGG